MMMMYYDVRHSASVKFKHDSYHTAEKMHNDLKIAKKIDKSPYRRTVSPLLQRTKVNQ